jgi:two-component system nitrogen regulation response regulator GlnG/two-component system response regulator HydG
VLVLVWSQHEPARIGEIALIPNGTSVLGRGDGEPGEARLTFGHRRPGARPSRPLGSPGISRRQLVLERTANGTTCVNVGKKPVLVETLAAPRALADGDRIEIEHEAIFLFVADDPLVLADAPDFAFGEADRFGFVGESPAAWAHRDAVALAARRSGHVLVRGPSGSGKELTARALHALSPRARGPFVARNAATLPEGVIDAELFGTAKNFPNVGVPERKGLLGEADGGTLFLDEIGELPDALQAHLLRVLDHGEYHRLGEDRARRADVRIVAATNRARSALKHDLAARLVLEVDVPGLDERRADVPLLARWLLRRMRATEPELARFFADDEPRLAPELVFALLGHRWTGHARELASLLATATAESKGHFVELTPGVVARVGTARPTEAPSAGSATLGREDIERALAAAGGNVSRAWVALGLPSRDALNRLIKKHGIAVRR